MPRRTQVGSVKNEVRPAAYATAPSSPSRNAGIVQCRPPVLYAHEDVENFIEAARRRGKAE
jgi:hypothetical protein